MAVSLPANWYPDPSVRYDLRYWDGNDWTTHVASGGTQSIDPVVLDDATWRGSFLDGPSLNVALRKKPFEVKAEYVVSNKSGRPIGGVRELDRKFSKRLFQLDSDRGRKYRFEVVDEEERPLLYLSRPQFGETSPLIVQRRDGAVLGQVTYATKGFRRTQFNLDFQGATLGVVTAEKWWGPSGYDVRDRTGTEIAHISLSSPLKPARYELRILELAPEPLRSLVFGAVIAIELALHRNHQNGLLRQQGGG